MNAEPDPHARRAVLDDRGVVDVGGPEAGSLLQRLVTNDVLGLQVGEARFAALLTPQGKILVDFLVLACGTDDAPRFLIDCPAVLAGDLARRLTMYRLRAKVTIADASGSLGVAAAWPRRPQTTGLAFADPRSETLGFRVIAPRNYLAQHFAGDVAAYDRLRILVGIPRGGVDFGYGEAFPHEANLDRLNGIDFRKGCYVGQEVVSRVEHRGTARKRVATVVFDGPPPPAGTDVRAGDVGVGTMGSTTNGHGLAMLRLDKVAEAAAAGVALRAGDTTLTPVSP